MLPPIPPCQRYVDCWLCDSQAEWDKALIARLRRRSVLGLVVRGTLKEMKLIKGREIMIRKSGRWNGYVRVRLCRVTGNRRERRAFKGLH